MKTKIELSLNPETIRILGGISVIKLLCYAIIKSKENEKINGSKSDK